MMKWGVLSTAKIGLTQVIPAIQRSKNGRVVAIASRNIENAKNVAKDLDIATAYGSYEELLDDPAIDAVYIPLPNALHKEWVIKAAEKKKHVLCEKPVAITVEELQEMIDACERNGVKFMEAFMYQFHPQHEKVKELIAEGTIGEVATMRASFTFFLDDSSNIRLSEDLAGGSMFDVGCYALHSIRNIFDAEPVSVYAAQSNRGNFQVDTTMVGVMHFADGKLGIFDSSFDADGQNVYEIAGSKGRITVPGAYRPDENENMEGKIIVQVNGETTVHSFPGDQYKLMVEHFAEAVLENKELYYNTEKITNQMKVLDAVYRSSKSQQVENV